MTEMTMTPDEAIRLLRKHADTLTRDGHAAMSGELMREATAVLADRRTMGRAEVAEYLGVLGNNLHYQFKHGLPDPFVRHRSGPVWWTREVEAFKAQRDEEQ